MLLWWLMGGQTFFPHKSVHFMLHEHFFRRYNSTAFLVLNTKSEWEAVQCDPPVSPFQQARGKSLAEPGTVRQQAQPASQAAAFVY
jgi:hypothetical protein